MKALLCEPTYYGVHYEINPWMNKQVQPRLELAKAQWKALLTSLTSLGVEVSLIPPKAGQPDMVFTANGGLVRGGKVALPNFRFAQRAGEREAFAEWFKNTGLEVCSIPDQYAFEGEGDALFAGDTLFIGYPIRSDLKAHLILGELFDCEVLPLELVHPSFYHLDTCFCPLSERAALYFPPAFDEYGTKVLQDRIEKLIAVSPQDAEAFCCNAVVVEDHIILNHASPALEATLQKEGLIPHFLDFSEFIKAGGAAKCMTLFL